MDEEICCFLTSPHAAPGPAAQVTDEGLKALVIWINVGAEASNWKSSKNLTIDVDFYTQVEKENAALNARVSGLG